jgi:hypothetical protein
MMRICVEYRQSPQLPPASLFVDSWSAEAARAALRRAAVILKIAEHHSRNELHIALADARQAILLSFDEAGADANAGVAVIEALDAASAISRNRA